MTNDTITMTRNPVYYRYSKQNRTRKETKMNWTAEEIDLVTLRMAIRSVRRNLNEYRKAHRSDPKSRAGRKYEHNLSLMEKYQALHIQKTGELY